MSGLAPLSWPTLRAWRKERGLPRLDAEDVDALFALDAVMMSPLGAPDALKEGSSDG
jgi:hypothetical protein